MTTEEKIDLLATKIELLTDAVERLAKTAEKPASKQMDLVKARRLLKESPAPSEAWV